MSTDIQIQRRLPIGAEVVEGGVHFRMWAPNHQKVEVVFEGDAAPVVLTREDDGYHSGFADGIDPVAIRAEPAFSEVKAELRALMHHGLSRQVEIAA